ncbi:MAG: hypothetical protein HS104_15120 [Polyangiaceae bacterium]|nr:hypothetical protein [Polyangiaceae bacterium]MCE7888697.1 hypothetical protein [Sorangiineae bacterium PRO1]MCL4754718.1 hypothetical protein [Myxococcales bacterium]
MKALHRFGIALAVSAGPLAFLACGGSDAPRPKAVQDRGVAVDKRGQDDRSQCDFKDRKDRDVQETTGPGAIQPNIRRVFAIVGIGEDARRVLLCREVDTNLDGLKDVVRTYNDKGEAIYEKADTDGDGRIDTWIQFARGRIAKVEQDTSGDGLPDEVRFYIDGQLSRVQRDTNQNGKPDVWEIYEKGRLQRMGVDLDHDGHVDRWDRDEEAARIAEQKEREEEERAAKEAAADAGAASDAPTDAQVSARKKN